MAGLNALNGMAIGGQAHARMADAT